jgi:D-alanyl-D-alanine dipeptidase
VALGCGAAPSGLPADVRATRTPDLVDVASLDPTIELDVRYATANNFVGRAVYPPGTRVWLQRPAAEAVVRAHRRLASHGYGLVLLDGYRPWSVTRLFWEITPPEQRAYVADPAQGSRHNRGCAVDVTLYDLASGQLVAMPSEYDDFSARAHPDYEGGTPEERAHRELLRLAMENEGFTVYPAEWWHFDCIGWEEWPVMDVPIASLSASR